jgi:hypothetical protein
MHSSILCVTTSKLTKTPQLSYFKIVNKEEEISVRHVVLIISVPFIKPNLWNVT